MADAADAAADRGPSSTETHRARGVAESFGSDAELYDRARPPYPNAVIERVMAASPGSGVLDVGCGTGTLARQLQAVGCTVLGVEPDERMATVARDAGVTVEIAAFEQWDVAGRTFDAVVAGTAWHWVDPVLGAAKAAQTLRPRGVLVPFGSVYELPPAVAHSLADAYRRVAPDSPLAYAPGSQTSILDSYGGLYLKAAAGVQEARGFLEPTVWRHEWQRAYGPNQLLELLRTSGGLTSLPAEEVSQILAAVADAARGLGETVTLPFVTWGLTAIRSDS